MPVYVSYHNDQFEVVLKLATLFQRLDVRLLVDRFECSVVGDWTGTIHTLREQASHAILLLSQRYFDSPYCVEELTKLQDRNIPLLGIVIDDLPVTAMDTYLRQVHLIDIREHDSAINRMWVLSILDDMGVDASLSTPSEKDNYIQELIASFERQLNATQFGTLSRQGRGISYRSETLRPRGYAPDLLLQGSYQLMIDNEYLHLENLISLVDIQPLIILADVHARGPSVFGMLLGLWAVHAYKHDNERHFPLYLDLGLWDRRISFADFLHQQWPLAHDWQSWIARNRVLFIIDDNDNYHPDAWHEIAGHCVNFDQHSCVFITPALDADFFEEYAVACVDVQPLEAKHLRSMAHAFLDDPQQQQLMALYDSINETSPKRNLYDVLATMDVLTTATEFDAQTFYRNFYRGLILQRWHALESTVSLPISSDEFIAVIHYLAFQMWQDEPYDRITCSDATSIIGDPGIIELGKELGVLRDVQGHLHFTGYSMQAELAADIVLRDGLYKYVTKPAFDADGNPIAGRWDPVILASYYVADPEQHHWIMDLIIEINPFLACQFAEQHRALLTSRYSDIVTAGIDLWRKMPAAHQALIQMISSLPHIDETALTITGMMENADWHLQNKLYELVLRLPYHVPDEVVSQVREIDRHFADARQTVLASRTEGEWVLYLSYLLHHPDPKVQRNSVALITDTGSNAALAMLASLLPSQSPTLRQEVFHAMAGIVTDKTLGNVIDTIRDVAGNLPLIAELFSAVGRPVTALVLKALGPPNQSMAHEMLTNIRHIPEATVQQIVGTAIDDEAVHVASQLSVNESDPAMKINELIQRRLRQLNDTVTANRFINEASRLLGSADDGKKRLTELTTSVSAQGAGDSEKPRRGTGDQLPEILLDELAHPDWMSRYKALQELAGYPAELGRPYFLEAVTHDEDIQVRVTALDILGKLHQLPETRAVLIEALQDDELLMIDTATDLIKTWDGFETKDLLPLLDHENVQTVAAVIEILTHHVEKRAVPYLTKRLHDERKPWLSDHHIGYLAAKALIALETPEAIQAVKDSGYVVQADSETIIPPAIERDQKPSKKYSTVEKFRLTLQALHSDDWSLTQKAAKYLKKLAIESKGTKNEDIINALEAALNDPVWTVRWAAVEALAWIKSYQSVPKIESLLDDPYWMVQVATVRTLTELDARSLAPRIAKLVGDPNTSVVEAAVEALGALNNPDIKDTLHQAMEHDSEFVRLAALTSLYNLFEENAARYLVQALRDPYNHVRWFAIKHLAPIADSSHLKSVVRLLPDRTGPAWESKTISDYAIEALQHMNTKESHHILEEWVQTRGDGNS